MSSVELGDGVLNEPGELEKPSEVTRLLTLLIEFKTLELLNLPIDNLVVVGNCFVTDSRGNLINGVSG